MGQIASFIRDLLEVRAVIPDYTLPSKIVPLLIVGDGMPFDPVNRKYLESFANSVNSIVNNDKVLPLIILDTNEVEIVESIAIEDRDNA